MSALPDGIRTPNSVHPYIAKPIEETDNSILSDKEVYELKGGDKIFLFKLLAGVAGAGAYLFLFNRVCQVSNFHIRGRYNIFFSYQVSNLH